MKRVDSPKELTSLCWRSCTADTLWVMYTQAACIIQKVGCACIKTSHYISYFWGYFLVFCRQTLTMSSQDLLIISLASNIMPGRWVMHNWIITSCQYCVYVTSERFMMNLCVLVRSCMMLEESWRRTETPLETTSSTCSKTAGRTFTNTKWTVY